MHLFRLNDSLTQHCLLNQTAYADDFRLALVGVFGSGVAVLSVLENLLIFYVFSTSRKLRRQNYANPVLLATFDIIVSLTYLFLASGHFFAYRLASPALARFWAKHMRVVYCAQHVALTISNFLLVVASMERFLANGPLCVQAKRRLLVCMVHHKVALFASIVISALLLKATIYFESDTLELPHCGLIDSLVPVWLNASLNDENNGAAGVAAVDWRTVRFWTRKLFTIFLPFLMLAYCNTHIVLHLRRGERRSRLRAVHHHYQTTQGPHPHAPSPLLLSNGVQKNGGITSLGLSPLEEEKSEARMRPPSNASSWEPSGQHHPLDISPYRALTMSPPAKNSNEILSGQAYHPLLSPTPNCNSVISSSHPNRPDSIAVTIEEPVTTITGDRTPLPYRSNNQSHHHHHTTYHPACSPSQPLPSRNPSSFGEKRGMRIATRTLVMVVGCYLISNSMTTIINIWEYLNVHTLRYQHYYAYLIASDVAALLTIVGCALRLPIYVVNDRRIRKAVARAFLRCRYCIRRRLCQLWMGIGLGRGARASGGADSLGLNDAAAAAVDMDLEKWSLVFVSNSLRSNLTGMLSQVDWATFRGKKSFDQLALLVQNRRRFLITMTINLGACEELPPSPAADIPGTSGGAAGLDQAMMGPTGGGSRATKRGGGKEDHLPIYLTEIDEDGEDEEEEEDEDDLEADLLLIAGGGIQVRRSAKRTLLRAISGPHLLHDCDKKKEKWNGEGGEESDEE